MPVAIPDGVKCELKDHYLKVTGPKGSLERDLPKEVDIAIEENEIRVTRSSDEPKMRSLHGLARALVNNMVEGVTNGFEKTLLIEGVGYRASMQGKQLSLSVGLSHPVVIEPPEHVEFAVEGAQTIKIQGIDKEAVGQVAADVRAWRKPEPYKGKGIRYSTEYVRRKVGKAGAK
jgi:large subunit ribosomal protein L6